MSTQNNSRYQRAASTPNIGSKSRARAMLSNSADPKDRQVASAAPRQAPPRARRPCMAGYDSSSSTVINMNGSGYDNPQHHQGQARARMMKNATLPRGPAPSAGIRTNISAVSDYRSVTRNRFK